MDKQAESRAQFWHNLFAKRDKGSFRVRHKSGRIYVVLGLALENEDSEERWVVVYHPEGKPNVLFYQSPHRFSSWSTLDGSVVPRFEFVDEAAPTPSPDKGG